MSRKLIISLAIWILYVIVIIFVPRLYRVHQLQSQSDFASSTIGIELYIAAVMLLGFVILAGWRREVGLKRPRPDTNWLILWLPLLFISLFFALGLFVGFKPGSAMLYASVNTLAIAVGEELAFRGVLFAGARSQFKTWGAIIFAAVVFGAVHVLNGFGTGDFVRSTVQAVSATLSGFLFIAILVRTGSLFPGMLIHFLWDLSIFSSATGHDSGIADPAPGLMRILMPIIFVFPSFLYALWLLRGVGKLEPEDVV